MDTDEIVQVECTAGGADKQRPACFESGDMLAGQIAIGEQATAVRVAGESQAKQGVVKLRLGDGHAEGFDCFTE